jgi:hypothetical protein
MAMTREILIALHAVGGGVAFIAGARVLVPPIGHHANRHWLFNVFLVALAWMTVFLLPLVTIDWPYMDPLQRAIRGGLCLLALYMGWRALQARRALALQSEGWRRDYVTHLRFILIALFEGFAIVVAIDVGMQGWLVAVIAVAGLLIGRWVVHLPRFVPHHAPPEAGAPR